MILRSLTRTARPSLVTTVGILCAAATGAAADRANFRIHTVVLAEGDERPVAANLTVFLDDSIYDFPLDGSREATIFDARSRQFTLVDGQREVQCRLTAQQLLQLTQAIQQGAQNTKNPSIRFAAAPSFQEKFDASALRLTLSGKELTYEAVGQKPQVASAVDQFREFADWFARLNATQNARPPAARLVLNEALWNHDLVPEQISRHIPGQKTYHSKHAFGWRLENEDLRRVDRAESWCQNCRQVSLEQYRRRHAVPTEPARPR